MELPFAEEIGHYWKTGRSAPEEWIERAKQVIKSIGGKVEAEGFGAMGGHSAYMLAFTIGSEQFKVVWPVLPMRYSASSQLDARRQAATLLYHDIKAKAMTAAVMGAKVAFFSYLSLPDGRTASEVATPELLEHFPLLLKQG